MMNTIRAFFCVALAGCMIVAGGCSKSFLDTTPKGYVLAQTVSDYDKLLNITMLSSTYDPQGGIVMGDEAVGIDPTLSNLAAAATYQHLYYAFQWADNVYQPTENAGEMYAFLAPVYTYNKVINEVMSATGDAATAASVRAEALASRAWAYLWLINYFGAPYNKATAAADPGFPIVSSSDVTVTSFSRGSVEGTYRFIINDLATAIPNLPVSVTNKYRMSRPAAEAILGKAYWFMGKYDSALLHLDAAITNLAQNSGQAVGLYNLPAEMTPAGAYAFTPGTTNKLYIAGFSNANTDKETLYSRAFYNLNCQWGAAVVKAAFTNLFAASDARLNFYSSLKYGGSAAINTDGDLRRIGPFYCNSYGMNLPDIYLMRAECEVRTGATQAAINDLQLLRQNRMAAGDAAVPSGLTNDQLIQFIVQERLREYGLLGVRWFDMRRLSADPLFRDTVYTHTYRASSGVQTITLQQPKRFTLRFPQAVIDGNAGMINNP